MERTAKGHSNRDTLRMDANRAELAERIARAVPEDGRRTPLEGITLHRSSSTTESLHAVSHPSLCVIAQGGKEVMLGDHVYRYDPHHYLLVTAELPIVGHVRVASVERPYLSLILTLDSALVSSVMVEAGTAYRRGSTELRALDVSPLDANLLDAVLRLVRLVESPSEAAILAPLVTREIVFRLLQGEQSDRLRHIAVLGGHDHRITRAVKRLSREYDRAIRVEDLADEIGMSASSFHQHFKTVTGMTPLQFQKQLRLQEARRLMFNEDVDAATAGYQVGYNDASHFSREYKRLFGRPPMHDVDRLRTTPSERVVQVG